MVFEMFVNCAIRVWLAVFLCITISLDHNCKNIGTSAVLVHGPYHVNKSQTLTMTCSFSAAGDGIRLYWFKTTKPHKCNTDLPCPIYSYEFGKQGQQGFFQNDYGTVFDATMEGNTVSKLTLKSAVVNDEGNYQCQLTSGGTSNVDSKMLYVQVKPDVTITPLPPSEIIENQQLPFRCSVARARPNVEIKWEGSNQVKSGTCAIIPDLAAGGECTGSVTETFTAGDRLNPTSTKECVVTWKTDLQGQSQQTFTSTVTFTVNRYGPHTNASGPESKNVIEGLSVQLSCVVISASPQSPISFTWTQNDTNTISNNDKYELTPTGDRVTIKNLQLSDDGIYKCRGDNGVAGAEAKVEYVLMVQVRPRVEIYEITVNNPVVGNRTKLKCRSSFARPAQILQTSWTFNGKDVTGDNHEGMDTEELTIVSVRRSDAGVYVCHMRNTVGTGQSAPLSLIVRDRPRGNVTLTPMNDVVSTGSMITMNCATSDLGVPPTGIIYRFSNTSIVLQEDTKQSLNFMAENVKQSGSHFCAVRNMIDWDSATGITDIKVEASVVIEEPSAAVEYRPRYDTVYLNLSCTASASNEISFMWKKDNKSLAGDFDKESTQVNGLFSHGLEVATRNVLKRKHFNEDKYSCTNLDHFSGSYTCSSSANAAGKTTTVHSPGMVVNVEYPAFYKGNSTIIAGEVNVSRVVIHCDVCANPTPSFTWTFNDEPLPDTDEEVTIDIMRQQHIGFYQCKVTNVLQSTGSEMKNFTFELIERGRPHSPTGFQVLSNATSQSLTLSWKPMFHGGFPPQHFKLAYKMSNESSYNELLDKIPDSSVNGLIVFTITGLAASAPYNIQLHAVNSRIDGEKKSPYVNTEGNTAKKPNVTLSSATVISDGQLEVTWTYSTGMRKRSTRAVADVSVVLQHRKYNSEESFQSYPSNGSRIPAVQQKQIVPGDFTVENRYEVYRNVYEGDLMTSKNEDSKIVSPIQEKQDYTAAIVGGVLGGVAAIIIIAVIIAAIILRNRNGGKKKSENRKKNGEYNANLIQSNSAGHSSAENYAMTSETRSDLSHSGRAPEGDVIYSQPNKRKKKGPQEAIYAEPDKTKKKKVPTATLR